MMKIVMDAISNLKKRASLMIKAVADCSLIPVYAAKTSERILQMASLLPKGCFMGLQLEYDADGACAVDLCEGPDMNVTKEDFEWVFSEYAAVCDPEQAGPLNLCGGNRKVYALAAGKNGAVDVSGARIKRGISGMYDYADSNFKDLAGMLASAGAVVRMIAGPVTTEEMNLNKDDSATIVSGPAQTKTPQHGMILISLPEAMPLRMNSLISLACPDLTAVELTGETCIYLPDTHFTKTVAKFLDCIMTNNSNCQVDLDEIEDIFNCFDDNSIDEDEMDTTIDDIFSDSIGDANDGVREADDNKTENGTPLEELELSIRAYNCLRRAGIGTIEDLINTREEKLLTIRNLGLKSREEIKQKLSEYQKNVHIAPVKTEDGVSKLDELIGLESVKNQVRKVAAFAKMKVAMADMRMENISMALNMEFVGNPGTAKTTVARILAETLCDIGILRDKDPVEVGRSQLVAEYVGQTAVKVKKVFEEAYGKLLFIDEAYSLADKKGEDFGDEAISTIVQEMENNREHTVVIFAGYPEEMKNFFKKNPGLRSRVPFTFTFPDYSACELRQIAELEARKRGFTISDEADSKVLSLCEKAVNNPDAGNGRFSRNLVENAILNYAVRVYGGDEMAEHSTFELKAEDFETPSLLAGEKKPNAIGFRLG